MTDKEINAGTAIAWALWAVAVVLLIAMWATGDRRIGATGIVVAIAAATATIRSYFVEYGKQLCNAFNVGRESVRPLQRR